MEDDQSDIAITYYKTALSIGAQLMAMLLLIGVGQSFIDQYYQSMSGGMDLKELAIMLVVANVLHRLTDKVPPMIGSLVGSGGISMGMSGSSSGSIMSSAATAATVISAVGGAMGRSAAALGGGMTALKAAFQQAQQHQAEGSGLFAGGSQAKGEGSGGFRSAMATAGAFAADMGANLAKGVGAIAKEAIADKMDIMKEKIAETSGGKVASEINTPGSTAQARQDRQDIATAHALRQESLGQDARDFMAQYRQANSSESGHSSGLASDHFTENSLSAGDSAPSMEPMNEEIADFVNKKSSKT